MIDAGGVKGARPPDYSVNLVAFFQQQIGQITSILAGDPGDQGALHLDLAVYLIEELAAK
jgi:hypothetical protein